MTGIPAGALRTAVLKALADEVKNAAEADKAALQGVMADQGIDAVRAVLADGAKVARITLAGGEPKPRVTDPVKFLAWVQDEHPGEVEHAVRDSYQKALLAEIEKAGKAVDPSTGNVVPGVEFRPSTQYLSVSYATKDGKDGGRDLIREAWQRGQLDLTSMLALPAGDDSDG